VLSSSIEAARKEEEGLHGVHKPPGATILLHSGASRVKKKKIGWIVQGRLEWGDPMAAAWQGAMLCLDGAIRSL
jgi:hypothetical protein